MRFTENFASSFKTRMGSPGVGFTGVAGVGAYSADTAVNPINFPQFTPGVLYNAETGFYNPGYTSTNGLNIAGLADTGTRLIARFSNIPAGVVMYAGIYEAVSSSSVSVTSRTSTTSRVRLVSADANGNGGSPTSATTTTCGIGPLAPISISSGTGSVTYEVMSADPLQVETFIMNIVTSYTANTSSNLPGLGTANVNGWFAPISTVTTQSAGAPIPRFADGSTSRAAFSISACATNLLFPFLTNQIGFDSGFAIANTSVDPFGTSPQQGACTLNYYGGTTGGGAAPAAQKSGIVAGGTQLIATLSSGGNLGIAATPGFQGYMIAQCAFQYAHGFAFISDVGANKIAESYLALIMDPGGLTRTGNITENLVH